MKRMPIPDEGVMKAAVRLSENPDFFVLSEYLFDFAPAYVVQRFKERKDYQEDTLDKGALQCLDDIREIVEKSAKWLGDIEKNRKAKGGH